MHANLFKKNLVTRQTVANITFVVHAMYSFLETKNARKFMKHVHERAKSLIRSTRLGRKNRKRLRNKQQGAKRKLSVIHSASAN
jgi:ABC-type branched-subunit amino acid transport system ATPase component